MADQGPSPTAQLLHAHVEDFNAGVRTGDFGLMLTRFRDDAQLVFVGVAAGPFGGRDAIAAAYRDQPPDDEILLLSTNEYADVVVGRYAWSRRPQTEAGELRLVLVDGEIAKVVVTFV
jgi:hypothetical protein